MSLKTDLRQTMERAEKFGFTITPTRNSHYKWYPPNGGPVIFSPSTPSDYRGLKNLEAQLRRAGLPR